jgi:drug/metabolite transporter (DMT)-like permease
MLGGAGFDAFGQNSYRYLGAAAFFLALSRLSDRKASREALRAWPRFLAPAAAVAVFQTTWVMGLYRTGPTTAAFAEHSSILFGVVGGAIFFADERRVVASWRFAVGAAAVAAGFTGVVLGKTGSPGGGIEIEGEFGLGVAFLAVGAVGWGSYGLLIKRLVGRRADVGAVSGEGGRRGPRDPLHAFAVTILLAAGMLLAVAAAAGDLGHIAEAGAADLVLLFGSGIACVGVGQGLYFASIRRIGVAVSQVFTLAAPFLTGLFSLLALGERTTLVQWASGTVLAAGVAWLVWSRARTRAADRAAGARRPPR